MLGLEAVDNARWTFAAALRAGHPRWRGKEVVRHAAMREVLVRFSRARAGVPASDVYIRLCSEELCAMVDKASRIGPANGWARYLRIHRRSLGRGRDSRLSRGGAGYGSSAAMPATACRCRT